MQLKTLTILLLASVSALVRSNLIYVADKSGNIVTLDFNSANNTISQVNVLNVGARSQPSWLFKGFYESKLWATFETGHIQRFGIGAGGSLQTDLQLNITGAPVHAGLMFNDSGVAVANYGDISGPGTGGGISFLNWRVLSGQTSNFQIYTFPNLTTPGLNDKQTVPRAHSVVADPDGAFFVVPDLGADKIRVFARIETNSQAAALPRLDLDIQLPLGTGPRHAAFFKSNDTALNATQWYLFVVNEFKNTITTFNVSRYGYPGVSNETKSLVLTNSRDISTLPDTYLGHPEVITAAAAAEIKIDPSNRFVTVSNRNVVLDGVERDSLVTFEINADGSLKLIQEKLVEITGPRGFDVHPLGNYVVVAGQTSSNIAVFARDIQSGTIGDRLAMYAFNVIDPATNKSAEIPHAIWDGH